ncbi:MAG: hypothetical protein ACLVL7_09800 [Anaerotruncus massiliensis (ex Togo et al. 2019)]
MKTTAKNRMIIMTVVLIVVLLLYSLRLMQLQVVEGESLAAQMERVRTTEQVIKAARGEILDRNGRPLAVNTIGRDVVINMAFLEKGTTNEVLLRLIRIMESADEDWIDNLPLTAEAPFRFKPGEAYETEIARLKNALGVAARYDDVVYRLKEKYGLFEHGTKDDPVPYADGSSARSRGCATRWTGAGSRCRCPTPSQPTSKSKRSRRSRSAALSCRGWTWWRAPSASM